MGYNVFPVQYSIKIKREESVLFDISPIDVKQRRPRLGNSLTTSGNKKVSKLFISVLCLHDTIRYLFDTNRFYLSAPETEYLSCYVSPSKIFS